MMAPISDPTKPAGSPARYKPNACPPNVASSDPAIPIAAVMKNPAGSRPGVSILARSPTTKPTRMVQMMLIALSPSVLFYRVAGAQCAAKTPVGRYGSEHKPGQTSGTIERLQTYFQT